MLVPGALKVVVVALLVLVLVLLLLLPLVRLLPVFTLGADSSWLSPPPLVGSVAAVVQQVSTGAAPRELTPHKSSIMDSCSAHNHCRIIKYSR